MAIKSVRFNEDSGEIELVEISFEKINDGSGKIIYSNIEEASSDVLGVVFEYMVDKLLIDENRRKRYFPDGIVLQWDSKTNETLKEFELVMRRRSGDY